MFISVKVKNFLSFGFEDTSLTMETGKARGKRNHVIEDRKINLLRFSAIFGANSSGKSNLVKAIDFAKSIIIDGFSKDLSSVQYYNRTNIENSDKPTTFSFEFRVNKKIYEYSFSISLKNRKFISESLKCNDDIVFIRDIPNAVFELNLKYKNLDTTQKTHLFFDTIKNSDKVLFLKEMNTNKDSLYESLDEPLILKEIYNIFDKSIKIVTPTTRVSDMNILFSEENKVENVLQEFGFDITGFSQVEDTAENIFRGIPQQISEKILEDIDQKLSEGNGAESAILHTPNGLVKFKYENDKTKILTLKCVHGQYGDFSLSEESDGLRRFLDLIDIILNPVDGAIYIVDEIDRSLNALVTKEFIDYYLNKTTIQNVQLIITTHETRLLDLNLLRKDEIWLFDKENGNTKITALTDYEGNIRSDVKLDTAYIEGRYAGVPKIVRGEA